MQIPLERPGLNSARIIAEAVALADEKGMPAVTMRGLAQRLGVEAMSLYNHIANKDELLSAMVEAVVAEFYPPRGGEWRAEMRTRAQAAHTALCRHPWAGGLIVSRPNMGPRMLDYIEATLACLVSAGFALTEADAIWNTLDAHIYGFTLQKLNFPFAPEDYAEAAAANIDRIPPSHFPQLHGLAVLVAARRYDGLHNLAHGLDLLLEGLQAKLARQGVSGLD
jgi:AcrR family transcriptional regulator